MNQAIAMPAAGLKAEATRAAIVNTAERLFRTLGYQKTAVADIARELRMSPANVYRFFPSKAAINEAICTRILAQLKDVAWGIARGPGTPPDRLRLLFRALQEQTMALLFHEKKMHDMVGAAMQEHWPVIDAHVEAIETAIRHILMDGQATGCFARTDANRTAKIVHTTMVAFVHPQVVEQCAGDDDLAGLADAMAGFVLSALRPHSDD
jgi:AcrR family transcriptional regulator